MSKLPAHFDRKKADAILERLTDGQSLRAACLAEGVERSKFHRWIINDIDGLANQYAHARDIGLDQMADELLEISDTFDIQSREVATPSGQTVAVNEDALGHRKLRVDTRKWYLSKLAPKRYGDRQAMELSGPDGKPVQQQVQLVATGVPTPPDEAFDDLV